MGCNTSNAYGSDAVLEHFQPPGEPDCAAVELVDMKIVLKIITCSISGFPINPVISRESAMLCNSTWQAIKNQEYVNASDETVSGVVYFYNEVRRSHLRQMADDS